MTVELIAALCTGIVSIIVAVGTLIASLKNKALIEKDAMKKDEQLKEIHVLVNSRLSEALNEIKDLRNFIDTVLNNTTIPVKAAT